MCSILCNWFHNAADGSLTHTDAEHSAIWTGRRLQPDGVVVKDQLESAGDSDQRTGPGIFTDAAPWKCRPGRPEPVIQQQKPRYLGHVNSAKGPAWRDLHRRRLHRTAPGRAARAALEAREVRRPHARRRGRHVGGSRLEHQVGKLAERMDSIFGTTPVAERLTRSRFRSSVRRFAPPTSSRSCSTWPSGESSTTAACRPC
jgi:hypothetical protein